MKFSTREDIEAPIDFVFRMASDFDGFERSALRRGVTVKRRETLTQPGAKQGWDIGFRFRGKQRDVAAELVSYDAPNTMVFTATARTMHADVTVDLMPLSRERTRLSFVVDLKPKNMRGRVKIQSLKIAKSNIMRRFRLRVANFAAEVEDSYRISAKSVD